MSELLLKPKPIEKFWASVIVLSALIGLSWVYAGLSQAQDSAEIRHISQLDDTLPQIAEKYLGQAIYAEAIAVATEAEFGLAPSESPGPGVVLVIPSLAVAQSLLPTATPSPSPAPSATPTPAPSLGPPPSGKIAFSFFNRALSRRVWEINLINADGSGRQVFRWNQVSEPALSPDGQFLAYRGWSAFDTGRLLAVTPLNDLQRFWPLGGFQEDADPDWSHDGSRVAFASQRESDRLWRLFIINGNGQDERSVQRLDGLPLHGEEPTWSHQDDRLIYKGCSPRGEQCGLWFITLDGAVSGPLVEDETALQPDGSPTAAQVVFASARDGNWNIYRVNLDGSDLRQLTDTPHIDGLPVWSPDGAWIAFQSTRPGELPQPEFEQGPNPSDDVPTNWGLWLMRADGSEVRQIFAFDGGQMTANRLDLPYGSRNWLDEQISWGR